MVLQLAIIKKFSLSDSPTEGRECEAESGLPTAGSEMIKENRNTISSGHQPLPLCFLNNTDYNQNQGQIHQNEPPSTPFSI